MSDLERYRIDEELGRGAMGVVHRAWDGSLERHVALKELLLPPALTPEARAELEGRFLREARAAAKLAHPAVVQVFDVFVEGERHFIAMELLEGSQLSALMDLGPMAPPAAVSVLVQILEGVAAAHAAGVVHRDLKPDNIFVLDDGRVKVTDFGIAKLTESGQGSVSTQFGTIMGTPGYMAPEQVTGGPIDARADIFALGVLGHELLAGSNPFMASTPAATMYRIVNEQAPDLTGHGIPFELQAVLAKAMAKDPAWRYGSAEEMASDLRAGRAPVTPAPVHTPVATTSAVSPPGPASKRHWLVAAAIGGALVVGALVILARPSAVSPGAGLAPSSAEPETAEDAPAAPEPEPAAPEPEPVRAEDAPPATPFWGAFFAAEEERDKAEEWAARARAEGFPALVLDTADYSTIGKPGVSIWVICAGPYPSEAEARWAADALAAARVGSGEPYPKVVDE